MLIPHKKENQIPFEPGQCAQPSSLDQRTTMNKQRVARNLAFLLLVALYLHLALRLSFFHPQKHVKEQPFSIDDDHTEDGTVAPTKLQNSQIAVAPCPSAVTETTTTSKITKTKEYEQQDMLWLTIAIPTVPRPNHNDYLSQTLATLYDKLNLSNNRNDPTLIDPLVSKIQVVIVNQRVHQHDIWQKNWERYHNHSLFQFIEVKQEWNEDDVNRWNRALGAKKTRVTQQTRDLSNFLKLVHSSSGIIRPSQYLMIMEDDFQVCSNILQALYHMINKSNRRFGTNWLDIRISYGFNGIVVHNNNTDVPIIAQYLRDHETRRPPDHLFPELLARETDEAKRLFPDNRHTVAYRYNLLDHMGDISTLRTEKQWAMPRCYAELVYPVMFEVEAFNKVQCPEDDIWPCSNIPDNDIHAVHFNVHNKK